MGVFSKRKGVRYRHDGEVVSCRFCEILRRRDEAFLYEDESVVVLRPLRPIVASHILIVPRAHIRNVNMLTRTHEALLVKMKHVAETVLLQHSPPLLPSRRRSSSSRLLLRPEQPEDSKRSEDSSKGTDDEDFAASSGTMTTPPPAVSKFKFSFHVPPFNSIDHVHMHAFNDEPKSMGVFGRIKYRTESWWCRSYEEVITRIRDDGTLLQETTHCSSGIGVERRTA